MPRYVILRHQPPPDSPRALHWDLLLETGQHLRAWALAEEPQPNRSISAEALPDHRLAYLEYEGPISGDRGTVSQWDTGTVHWQQVSDVEVIVLLEGRRLQGRTRLSRTTPDQSQWEFTWGS